MAQVEVERSGRVAMVILSRPEHRNAVSLHMLEELVKALGILAVDPEVRAVILAGAGSDFCAGADLADLEIMQPPERDYARSFEEALAAIAEHPVPVVARVQGAALGAGCQFVVACDLAVAADDARLGIPSARLGVLINFENVERLVLAVGPKRAAEILLLGREVSGAEAAGWGLVNQAVRSPELEARTEQLTRAVAAGAPMVTRGSKRGIRVTLQNLSIDRVSEGHKVGDFDMMVAEAFASEDLREGIRAFRERRDPEFEGR